MEVVGTPEDIEVARRLHKSANCKRCEGRQRVAVIDVINN